MSNFFEDLGAAAQKVAGSVRKEVKIAAREQNLKDAFRQLGQMYYQAVCKGEPAEGNEFAQQIARIRELKKEIQTMRDGENTAGEEDFEENA